MLVKGATAVKAHAAMNSTIKQWSNHEKTTMVPISQLTNNLLNLNFTQQFLFKKHMGGKHIYCQIM